MRAPTIAFVIAVAASASAAAQAQKPAAPQPAPPPPASQQVAPPSGPAAAPTVALPTDPASSYTYQREGRRDPFLTLVGTGSEPRPTGLRREGPAGMTVAEISVRGIVQSRGELVAMVHGPDNKTYLVHQGDKFADGAIKTITPQGLVIIQEVNDPLSLVKQREVRKLLRSLEDGKE